MVVPFLQHELICTVQIMPKPLIKVPNEIRKVPKNHENMARGARHSQEKLAKFSANRRTLSSRLPKAPD
jgi:hypothetical protein